MKNYSETFEQSRNRPVEEYGFAELRQQKLALYDELQAYFQTDFLAASDAEIWAKCQSIGPQEQEDTRDVLVDIESIIQEQIAKINRDAVPNDDQKGLLESLNAERRRVNVCLIAMGYFT